MSNSDRASSRLRNWTRTTVATLAVGAVLAVGGQAHAAEAISASPSSVRGGATVTVSGSGWLCNGDVEIVLAASSGPAMLVDTVGFADRASGNFRTTIAAPNDAAVYTVTATYDAASSSAGCAGQATTSFTVVAAPTPSTSSTTSTTSASTTSTTTTTTTTLAPSSSSSSSTAAPTTSGATTSSLVDSGGATSTTAASTSIVGDNSGATTTAAGPTSLLPVTGSSSYGVVPYALLLASIGGLLVLTTRRKPA
jgi:hypothetical protein